MLSQETIQSSLIVAEKATLQGMRLAAEVDTPLQQLCDSTQLFSDGLINDQSVTSSMESVTDEAKSAFIQESDNTSHSAQLSALVEQIKNIVNTHLSFTRNTVLANVNEYVRRVTEDMKNYEPDPLSLFNIKVIGVPSVLSSGFLEDDIKKNAWLTYVNPEGFPRYESKGPEELLEIIKTGSSALDDEILKWISSIGTDKLVLTWENFFAVSDALADNVPDFYEATVDPETGADTALMIYLLARGAKEKTPDGCLQSKDKLDTALNQYMESTGFRLLNLMGKEKEDTKNGLVVSFIKSSTKTIYVNKRPYLNWLKNGGKNEVLLGSLVKGMGLTKASHLLERAQDAEKAWDTFVSISNAQFKNMRMNQFIGSLRTHFFSMIKNREEIEEDMFKVPTHIESISKHFEEEIEAVNYADLDRVEEVCCSLMCKARYFYTDSFKILQDINTLTKANPDMEVKQAALVATINYVTDYVSDQIQVLK